MKLCNYVLSIIFLLSVEYLIGADKSDSGLINKTIQLALIFGEMSTKNNIISNEQLELQRTNFLSQIKKNNSLFYPDTCYLIISMFYNRKKHYLENNQETPVFINDALFEKICPLIINNKSLKTVGSRRLFYYFSSDAEKINELIYKHHKFPQLTKTHKIIKTGLNGIITFINFFRKKENATKPLEEEGCNLLIERFCDQGFYKGDTLYKGTKNRTFLDENLEELPCVKDQTLENRIDFLKTAFEPRCYNLFNVKNFSGDLKEGVHVFLLCLKRYEKILHSKVPRYIKLSILQQLEKYRLAQKVRPILLDHIKCCKELQLKEGTSMREDMHAIFNFFCNDLLIWFDKEALQ